MKKLQTTLDAVTGAIVFSILVLLAPMLFNINPYIVLSGSMEPAVKTGSLAYVDVSADPQEMKAGDVIAFRISDLIVTHRIVEVKDREFITKGDANETEDLSPVPKTRFVGKVLYSIPYVGYIISKARSPFLMFFLVFLGGCHVIFAVLSNNEKGETK